MPLLQIGEHGQGLPQVFPQAFPAGHALHGALQAFPAPARQALPQGLPHEPALPHGRALPQEPAPQPWLHGT